MIVKCYANNIFILLAKSFLGPSESLLECFVLLEPHFEFVPDIRQLLPIGDVAAEQQFETF